MNAREELRLKIDEMLRSVLTEAGRRPIHEAIDTFARDYLHEAAEAIYNAANEEQDFYAPQGMDKAADLLRRLAAGAES